VIYLEGLQSKEEHLKLARASSDTLKLVTIGLSERNVRLRKLDFINKDTVAANFDNNKRISGEGKGLWGVDTYVPDELPDFIKTHEIDYVLIMSDAVKEISAQLDALGVEKYYSSSLIRELITREENAWRNKLENQDPILMEVMKSIHEPILRCQEMESSLSFRGNGLFHCCAQSGLGFDVKICDFYGGKLPLDQYNRSFRDIVLQNIAHNGPCKGCPGLQYGPPNIWSRAIKHFYINVSQKCQLRCKYCYLPDNYLSGADVNVYSVLPLMEDLLSHGMIEEGSNAIIAGGEPTLYEYFDETSAFCVDNGIKVEILTNGIIFSQSIVKVLKSGGSIMIDTDSGIRETYKTIKGADCHDRVWENIKRYKETGNIALKYILTKDNMDECEISAFIEKCKWAGVDRIIISAQVDHKHPIQGIGELHKEYLESANFLYEAAFLNKINVSGFMYFSDEEIAAIKS
jgi:MoaA/NifB/PqqE/SkfB family radical SAM enzyme